MILIFMVTQFGLIGAAAAWVLRVSVDAGLLFSAARFWAGRSLALLPPLVFIVAAYLFARIVNHALLPELFFASILALGVVITGMVFVKETRVFWERLRFRASRASRVTILP